MKRTTIAYGDHPQQFGHLYLPEGDATEPLSVVVVIHGGFWSGQYALNLGTQYAVECARAGYAAWNIEYRRVGAGGLWPEISSDVASAVAAVATVVQDNSPRTLNLADVRLLGHSAGGHLAVWLAGERDVAIRPSRVVSQAGVLDLVSRASYEPIRALFDVDYDDAPQTYRAASPLHRVPTGIPVHCIHGAEDVQVSVSQSEEYAQAARAAGDHVTSVVVDGEDHFAFLQPGSRCWKHSFAAVVE
ncbi:lipase [Rhodococcus sp. 06-621-2]|nr:alpha/beta hydrolase [Rhodococcus sp. 06-621-2]OZC56810.1 lipase [Rhodococcus sp. 06-621-2]